MIDIPAYDIPKTPTVKRKPTGSRARSGRAVGFNSIKEHLLAP